MNEWKRVLLGDILTLNYGKGLPQNERTEGNIPVYSSAGITGFHSVYLVDKPGIIIGRKGTVGSVYYSNIPFYCIDTAYYLTQADTNENLIYIYYLLNFLPLKKMNTDSAVPGLNRNNVYNLIVNLPPLTIQRRIAAFLSSLDDEIENNRKTCEKLEEIAQAIFKRWFVDFEFPNEEGLPYKSSGGEMVYCEELGQEIPKGWESISLSDVIDFQNGYAFKSNELIKDRTLECYDVFKMGHIKRGGGINKEGTKSYIEKNKCLHLLKYVLKKGDLLMSMTDMKDNVAILGNTALMDENDRYIVNQRVGLIRSNGKYNIYYPFLYFLTNNPIFVEDLRSRANRGVQVNLSTSEIKASKFPIPKNNLSLLKMFDDFGKHGLELYFSKSIETQALQQLRDSLLPKLMSGELAVDEVEA